MPLAVMLLALAIYLGLREVARGLGRISVKTILEVDRPGIVKIAKADKVDSIGMKISDTNSPTSIMGSTFNAPRLEVTSSTRRIKVKSAKAARA